jgi:hypothetical protein
MSTPAATITAYKDLIRDYYAHIYAFGGVEEWWRATGTNIATRIREMDALLPEEENKRSKVVLYVDPTDNSICNSKGHYTPAGSNRWTPNSTFVPNQKRNLFYYNDIVTVERATSAYSGGLVVHSHKFNHIYYLMTRNITKHMLVEITKGVLIGSFTFEKTGGYLSLKMIDVS